MLPTASKDKNRGENLGQALINTLCFFIVWLEGFYKKSKNQTSVIVLD